MKSFLLVILALLVTQSAFAAKIRAMQHNGTYWVSVREEKLQDVSSSNFTDKGAIFVAGGASIRCNFEVADLATAASIVASIDNSSVVECFSPSPVRNEDQISIWTKKIMVIKSFRSGS